jgi:DNA-directed RNA polymerase subunit RPC12/RpoP
MPIHLACWSCGKPMRAPSAFAGRRVKCPGCGAPLSVPEEVAVASGVQPGPPERRRRELPPPLFEGVVQFRCACGKAMQAHSKHAGRLARCPACGDNVIVPAVDEGPRESRFRRQKSEPAPRQTPPPRPADEEPADISELDEIQEVEEFEEIREESPPKGQPAHRPRADAPAAGRERHDEEDHRPLRKPARKVKRARIGLWIFLTLFFLTIFGSIGAGVAVWIWSRGVTDDLALVPADATAFVSIRTGETAATPLGQKLWARVPAAEKAYVQVLKPADTERVTVVLSERTPNPEDGTWVVTRTARPIDHKLLAKELGEQAAEQKFEGKTYYIPAAPNKPPFWIAGDHVLVTGRVAALKKAMSLPGTRTPGPLDPALAEADAGRHFVAAFAAPGEAVAPFRAVVPAPYRPLFDATLVSLTGEVTDTLALDLTLTLPSEAQALAAREAVEHALNDARKAAPPAAADGRRGKGPPEASAKVQAFLNALKAEQNGPAVGVKVTIEGAALEDVLSAGSAIGAADRLLPLWRAVSGKGAPALPTRPAPGKTGGG